MSADFPPIEPRPAAGATASVGATASAGESASTGASSGPDLPGVIAPPPLIYLSGLGIGFGLQAVLPAPTVPAALRWPVGGALALGGFGLARSFFKALGRARTPVNPYRAPTALVTSGPYRFSRNPGYLGLASAYAGITLLGGAVWPFLSLLGTLAVIDRGVIAREERYLEGKFGEEYLSYRSRTRRWL
jgi:protein-S-isoprenylcysteine O-methyltransferase Ste14